MLTPWKESYDQPRQHIEKQRHYFANKGLSSQGYVFPVVMYACESWTIKKASTKELILLNCGVGEDSWESLDCKEIQPVHSEGDQPWDFFGRNDAKAETPVLGHLMRRVDSLEKTLCWEGLGAGGEGDNRGWDGWMASRTRWMWVWVIPGVGDEQGGLVCCDSWGCKDSDMT